MTDTHRPRVKLIQLDRRHPAISIGDLTLMLEIDMALGRKKDFRRRVQRALNAAWRQGRLGIKNKSPRRNRR